jgi:hypothetical protein
MSKRQRIAVSSAAKAVRKSASAVAKIARDSTGATATRSGRDYLFDRMSKTLLIGWLMCDILDIVARTGNPELVAFLIGLAQYLAGIMPSPDGGRPPDHEDDAKVADLLPHQGMRRAA